MRQLMGGMIALLLVYGGWQVIQALRAGRREKLHGARKPANADSFEYVPTGTQEPESGETVAVYSHEQPNMDMSEKAATKEVPLDSFAIELELQRLRMELSALQEGFESQQKEIVSLRESLDRPVETKHKPAIAVQEQDMSPEYDEALALARRGIMADVIASRCGITRAEADLVASLASRGQPLQVAS